MVLWVVFRRLSQTLSSFPITLGTSVMRTRYDVAMIKAPLHGEVALQQGPCNSYMLLCLTAIHQMRAFLSHGWSLPAFVETKKTS